MEKLPSIIHESWHPFLQPIFDNDFSLKLIQNQILPKDNFYPAKRDIFKVFSMPLKDIKVVILGQDPYPQEGQAIGLSFAVSETTNFPASLRIIQQEVGKDIDRTLSTWVNQGVFLLNTALTVERGKAGSHLFLWKGFTNRVIRIIAAEAAPIWLLWGRKAQEAKILIDNEIYRHTDEYHQSLNNVMLLAPHPAAEAYAGGKAGFYGCHHFQIVNNLLSLNNKPIINW